MEYYLIQSNYETKMFPPRAARMCLCFPADKWPPESIYLVRFLGMAGSNEARLSLVSMWLVTRNGECVSRS